MGNALIIAIIVGYFGGLVAYIDIAAGAVVNFTSKVLQYQLNTMLAKCVLCALIMLPLGLIPTLKHLAKAGIFSIVAVLLTLGTVLAYFFIHVGTGQLCKAGDDYITYGLPALPQASPTMGFLYFLMYVPTMLGNFAIQPLVPVVTSELTGTLA